MQTREQHTQDWPFIRRRPLAATENAPYWARRLVSDALEQWRLPDLAETAELLVSELVTNSVNALRKVDRRIIDASAVIMLKISTDYHSLLVEVWDRSPDLPQMQPNDVTREGGRGLALVQALSDRWGYYLAMSGGKVVWFTLGMPRPQG